MSAAWYLWLGAAMAIFISASAALRRHVDHPSTAVLILALALYTAGNLVMVRLMRESGMAVAVTVSAIIQLLMANLVALLLFGERPAATQLAGIALGIVAMALVLLPGRTG